MNIYAAPLQGYTEAPWRHYHSRVYTPASAYFAPFVRVEHGAARRRDLNDVTSPLNAGLGLVPQVIARDASEFEMLALALADNGLTAIDLNMGCPFPPQTKRGRGAALVGRSDELGRICEVMKRLALSGLTFSVKMRLGLESPDEWEQSVETINAMPLTHVTIHPRVARQQYSGELHLGQMSRLALQLVHPWIFNGDIRSAADIARIAEMFPSAAGVMIGRGLLGRPSLTSELAEGREWSPRERLDSILRLHDGVFGHYSSTLCGPAQILSKVKPFWDYLVDEIGPRQFKPIHKSNTLRAYTEAIDQLKYLA